MPLPWIHYLYSSGLPKYLRIHDGTQTSWALVTGASDGIGQALCEQLSAQGFNIVLHGRNVEKLDRVRAHLQAAYPGRSYRLAVVDSSTFTPEDIQRMVEEVVDLPLTVLINNVGGTGMLSSNFKHFETTTPAEMTGLFKLNALFPLHLTQALLPQLEKRTPSLILCCGSQGYIGQPYMATYSATKGALHSWIRGLAAEQRARKSGVEILEVLVGATYTQQLAKEGSMKPNLFTPSAESMARSVLARVGNGHRSVTAYFWHGVQYGALSILPNSTFDSIVGNILLPQVEPKNTA